MTLSEDLVPIMHVVSQYCPQMFHMWLTVLSTNVSYVVDFLVFSKGE